MPNILPLAQDGTDGANRIQDAMDAGRAFIQGPDAALWVGVLAFLFIFVVVLFWIIHGRVVAPARAKANQPPDAGVFAPAGADADISFDDPFDDEAAPEPSKPEKQGFFGRKKKKKEAPDLATSTDEDFPNFDSLESFDDQEIDEANETEPEEFEAYEAAAPDKPKKRFAGLFSRNKTPKEADDEIEDHLDFSDPNSDTHRIDDADSAEIEIHHDEEPAEPISEIEPVSDDHTALEAERREIENERIRLAEEREDMLERRRAEEDERLAALEKRNAENEVAQQLREIEAKERELEEKTDAMRDESLALKNDIDARLEARFADLSARLAEQNENQSGATAAPQGLAAFSNDQRNDLATEISELRKSTENTLNALNARLDKFENAGEGTAQLTRQLSLLNQALTQRASLSTAGRIQLNELVRAVMPPDRFKFAHRLSNGRIADCALVTAAGQRPYSIDARFPIEAFETYMRDSADSTRQFQAGNDYRRALLRHIVDIAEYLIIPGETADAAIMFAPSDVVFNNLYTEFMDVIQDSYRARVWIVSPTSLMAIVHLMGASTSASAEQNFAAGATVNRPSLQRPVFENGGNNEISDIQSLRTRADKLAQMRPTNPFQNEKKPHSARQLDKPAATAAHDASPTQISPASSLSPEEEAFERLERLEAEEEARLAAKRSGADKTPFPLR
ncbi:MAG: DNA recombination protein RmuC [Marinicaulis sp.]|nr:DNA recombination protein RmuC [Marinicaulis sp.]